MLKIFHTYNHSSSIFDEFEHNDKKTDEDTTYREAASTATTIRANPTDQLESVSTSSSASTSSMSSSSKTQTFQNTNNDEFPIPHIIDRSNVTLATDKSKTKEFNKNLSSDKSKLILKTLTTTSIKTININNENTQNSSRNSTTSSAEDTSSTSSSNEEGILLKNQT